MISRFKNALLNAVSNVGIDTSQTQNGSPQQPASGSSSNSNFVNSHTKDRSNEAVHENGISRPVKYEYCRPHFLNLSTWDEIVVTADHIIRPIIVPRDITALPWNSGYAETINSGKSKMNEDQARVYSNSIKVEVVERSGSSSDEVNIPSSYNVEIPYRYFGIFDGHAGSGAAVAAAAQLHNVIHEKLSEVGHHLLSGDTSFCETISQPNKKKPIFWFPHTSVTNDSLIVGALESAFQEMDEKIRRDNLNFEGVNGGCTVVVVLFLLNKIFIANAGDSRAILCKRNSPVVPLSQDFTPESERARVRYVASLNPKLLGDEFTVNEYLRRPVKKDLGSRILYRSGHMTGWAYKTTTADDLKFPVVFGNGKRSRVLATIGVTRGFGDHELCAHGSNIRIKPFLSSQPEVKIIDMDTDIEEDDVIVMATDGLWDVTANETVSRIVFSTIEQFPQSEPSRYRYRYTSAAQDLVMYARGKFTERNWKMADGSPGTIDDISVFVIPVSQYAIEHKENILRHQKKEPEIAEPEDDSISER